MSHILVLEDESVIRLAVRRLLERNGYQVSEAGSVEEAGEHHLLSHFDLIIADLRLPGLPGTDIIARADGVPVLIMTSYASLRSAVDSMRMGAVDYIAKPFDNLSLVVQRLQRVIDARIADTLYGFVASLLKLQFMQLHLQGGGKLYPNDAERKALAESREISHAVVFNPMGQFQNWQPLQQMAEAYLGP